MASRNLRKKPPRTHEGGPAQSISPLAQLERSVMSCLLWEREFYESGETIAQRISTLVQQVPVVDIANLAIRAREDMKLRHVPLLLAVEMLRRPEGRPLFGPVAERILLRPDDVSEFLAMSWRDGKTPLANQVKRHLGEAFRRFSEYQLAKYNGGQKSIHLRDVLRMTRPKPNSPEQAALWGRLIKNELATPDTWEVELSRAGTTGSDKRESWERLLREQRLGGLAMLRNLRNMREADVNIDMIREGITRIEPGRLLPINFIAAARHNPQFESELEAKFLACFAQRERYAGDTIVLIDVSSSMDCPLAQRSEMTRLDVACSLAMIARESFRKVRVWTFSNRVVKLRALHGFALRDRIHNSQPHGGTELGKAINQVPKCDRLIVITDEQSHDAVPDRRGYMINVASAKHGVGYGMWTHIDGWSDKVMDYIIRSENLPVDDMPASDDV